MSDVREPGAALTANDAGQQLEAQPSPEASGVPNEVFQVRRGMFGGRGGGDTTGYGGLVRRVQLPGAAQRPYGGYFDDVADELERAYPQFAEAIERVVVDRGELTFVVKRTHLREVMQTLRDDPALRFEFSAGVAGVHYPDDAGRELHAVWPLLSITHNRRVRVETTAPDADPHVPSVVGIYPGDDWPEREAWDMFGLVFDGHPALTRILMPDDWPGHPQRKDYPLGGIPVEYHGAQIPPPDERRSYT
ncbi:NADH dehydrogenase subunit C [Motilibacter rhizosphaerae]|uniref:NADH-quinone oxidoreductase subunit C n=1 Tax=Motilibacter rhizosphaerae TaxID=598652 RepID=A0A4Q7NAA7_9ACTN|nr:NADH-quinone oxidoreductase subunit C [Motilibacter rhizosphaerae]RZS79019.1 NADH dehydrogenase subunit C [Motilibacter rhizosphaerae]